MADTIHDEAKRARILARVERITPGCARRWGKMTIEQAVAHMGDQLRMALGEVDGGSPVGALRFAPFRFLILYVLPWPEGKAQAPQASFTTEPSALQQDVSTLRELIDRVAAKSLDGEWPTNPVFGRMTGRDWGVLSHRHLDHHLRQFGL